MARRGRPKHPDILTPREWEVLKLVREGCSNEEIAQSLGVTLSTARFHVSEIIGKLGVANRREAAAWQPDLAAERPTRAWALTPIAALRHVRWNAASVALGATVTAIALVLVALLVWGVARTLPASSGAAAAICTPGPTFTPSPTVQKGTPLPPDLRNDATRQAEIDEGRQRNRDWSNRFITAGCDPRALPDLEFEQFRGLEYHNPDEVAAGADLIIVAHVTTTSFSIGDGEDIPNAHVVLQVVESLKGDAVTTVSLSQGGGPVRQLYWGALAHATGLPLLLAGEDVILFAKRYVTSDGTRTWAPLGYVGVYQVRNGLVYADDANPCAWAIDGTPEERFTNFITEAVARTSDGQISAAPSCGDFNGTAAVPARTPRP